jgi:hypothetical protein
MGKLIYSVLSHGLLSQPLLFLPAQRSQSTWRHQNLLTLAYALICLQLAQFLHLVKGISSVGAITATINT